MEINNKAHWKWGIFYYNPDDKRIFPPKRIPYLGWTVNFANWKSVAVFVAIMALFVCGIVLIKS